VKVAVHRNAAFFGAANLFRMHVQKHRTRAIGDEENVKSGAAGF
jgi:hypothetical protein